MSRTARTISADHALLPGGWAEDVRVTLADGAIAAVEPGGAEGERCAILLPGLPNLHSHAFQRGMAGLAETRGPASDNFWTWRETMYRFALTMNPEQAEAVAAQAYCEMLESGFTRVGEFHYLHHAPDGRHYADLAEMALRIASAAETTGIALTLLPVFYAHSTFGGAPPNAGQRRFICDPESFARLLEASGKAMRRLPGAVLGAAPHSLRAVTPEELTAVARLVPEGPLHIHAAEQVKEVEDSLAWSGARPVEWLLGNAGLDRRWCVIHATHMSEAETRGLAASGAAAGLCPVTEANLGDGIFPGPIFVQAGGAWGVGTDSNVLISAPGELRQLEYAQRLAARQRNVMAQADTSTGFGLYASAHAGGSRALGAPDRGIAPGAPADLVSLTLHEMPLADAQPSKALDGWIFAGAAAVDSVWVNGVRRVESGRHVRRDVITERFRHTMRELLA